MTAPPVGSLAGGDGAGGVAGVDRRDSAWACEGDDADRAIDAGAGFRAGQSGDELDARGVGYPHDTHDTHGGRVRVVVRDPSSNRLPMRRSLALAALCASLGLHAQFAEAAPAAGTLPLPLTGAAYRVAQQGYDAYARHDYAAAERYAREAIRQRPDLASLRLLLANAQAAQRRWGDASRTLADAQRDVGPDASLVARRRQIDAQIAAATAAPRASPSRGGATPSTKPGAGSPDNLTGEAYVLAQRAYAAYASRDYAGAERDANAAIALRPDVLRLQLLAIDAASAAGRPDDAWQAALDATKRFGDHDELRRRRAFVGEELAPKSAAAAQKARDAGDFAQAAAHARDAIAYAPDRLGYRLQLFDALAASRDMRALEQAATDVIGAGVQPVLMPYVVRGYARAAQGRFDDAEADFSRALQAADASQRDQRVARAIVADVWTAAGEPQRALDALAPLKPAGDDTDALIASRRFDARERLAVAGQRENAPQPVDIAIAARPVFDCIVDAYGAACDVYAADPGFAARRKSILAAQRGDHAAAVAYAREAVAASPRSPERRIELVDALVAAGDMAGAKAQARAALDAGLLDGAPPLQAAYVAQRAGDDRRSLAYFAQADAAGELPPAATADAGYAAFHAHADAPAAGYFARAIDHGASPPDGVAPATLLQLEDLRNAHADVTRSWGFIASLNYRGAGLQPGVATGTAPGTYNSWQTGLEAYWRPFGSLGERMFEVYARAYQDFGAGGTAPSGISTALGAIGARAKPFETVNAIVAFERLIPIGSHAPSDWLARLAYSGGFGTERRLDVPSWWTVQDYAEVGHYVSNGWNYGTAYFEAGRTYRLDRISPKLTVFPYGVIGADYDSSIDHSIPVGIGIGVSSRYWFRDSFYDSPRSYIDVSVQYRWRITGDGRGGGVFFGTVLSY
ncbi:Bacteriophage N adsorption protein A C-term [Paraburkholderia caballeronis]|uniref:Bacteriophage N adsorption protein A C-term n=1 Tax=Paraburkholderia caballeronis TaxID=416943 RepID=A0A1H7U1Z2_9BURK|nr:adsorption protein A [Paraburkholderia caballeronis]PXW98450.1 adsorption protein A [Paraburkholderia caballeronis]RAJ95181.1 adsorption protein A [Paraburkholderia caballeronis]SEC52335.1 Bacteriophage N adsorption protein A C-term [Paraburkholderia caballeronis]SEL90795.1 Bacteriophage N adsorption protein A C-term [Paraburkholderia caballeronis]